MRDVCRTGRPRICVVVLIMYLELALSLQLQLHFGGRTVAALYKLGGDPRPIVMQELKHTGDQSPAPEEPYQPPALKIWVQLVTDNQALGEPTQIKLDAQSNVDDLCSEVHDKYPQLTGISAAELIASREGALLDSSNQWRRDAPLTDIRTTLDSPLYIHAPTTESAAGGLASVDKEGRSQLSESPQLLQLIENLVSLKLKRPEDWWLAAKEWTDVLKGNASPANLMQVSNTLHAPSEARMTPVIDLFSQYACRVGVVLGPARCGKSEFLQARLPKLVAGLDSDVFGEKQIVRLFANQCVSDEYLTLERGRARVDMLIDMAIEKVPELSNQDQSRHIKVDKFLNECGVILIIDELFQFCKGLDTAGLQDFCTALFRKFDNGAPGNPSYLIFADTSGFSVPLMLTAQEVGGNVVRNNLVSMIPLDQEPFGSGAAVSDAKILVAAFLKKSGCPDEVITQVGGLSTPYVAREFSLASTFAECARAHGWTQQIWQERLRYQIRYDLKYYAEDIRKVYATLRDDKKKMLAFSDWLRYVRALQAPDTSEDHQGYVASRRLLLTEEFQAFCMDDGRVLPAPGLETLAQVLNLFLGPDRLGGTSLERETHESAVLTIDRVEATAEFAIQCNYQAEIGACHSIYAKSRVADERREQQIRNLGDRLLPMSAACAQMVYEVFDRRAFLSIYKAFKEDMGWPAKGDPQDLACKDWLRLYEKHPQQIVYMARVATSHPETKSIKPLSQLYCNEQLAFTEAQAAGEEYPNTDTLAFFNVTAQQEDKFKVQKAQTFQADVVTCLCAPYEYAGQVGARRGQGGVEPVLAQLHPEEMPAVLGKWGCDAELWSKIQDKHKLLKYATEGQEGAARKFIKLVRRAVAKAEAAPARARPPPSPPPPSPPPPSPYTGSL